MFAKRMRSKHFSESSSHNTSTHSKSAYRPEIDGLRALAVIAVIINYFDKDIIPSGYLGVDICFVISGFVITSSLAGRASRGFGDFLLGFYTRRIKRLVPALVLFVIVTSLLISLFDPKPGFSLETGFTSLFGLSNELILYRDEYSHPSVRTTRKVAPIIRKALTTPSTTPKPILDAS